MILLVECFTKALKEVRIETKVQRATKSRFYCFIIKIRQEKQKTVMLYSSNSVLFY